MCSLWALAGAFTVGLLLGANAGFLALALFAASRREDDR
jgi:hypothetical protein